MRDAKEKWGNRRGARRVRVMRGMCCTQPTKRSHSSKKMSQMVLINGMASLYQSEGKDYKSLLRLL
jgi:hypothetical protein